MAVTCSALACGGALQKDDGSSDGGTKTTMSAPLPPTTPFGVWELTALDGLPGGNGSTGASDLLVLELRDDGHAIARKCTRPYFDPGFSLFRCADVDAYVCAYGTLMKESTGWRVDIPDLKSPAVPKRGDITIDANDAITVRYVLPKYAAGHFTRVAADRSPTSACASP